MNIKQWMGFNMKNILIIDDKENGNDTSADFVGKHIEDLGGNCVYLRLHDLANKKSCLSVSYDEGVQHIIFKNDVVNVDLTKEIQSVFFWRPRLPKEIIDKIEGKDKLFYRAEWGNFMRGIYLSLKDCFWMNPYPQNVIYEEKVYQLKIAQEIGFRIPQSFITTSIEEASQYLAPIKEDVVYKPFSQNFWEKKKEGGKIDVYGLYTTVIKKEDLNDSEHEFPTPNIFQVYVPKKIELRITCVGKAVMACEIQSQKSEIAKHDWRHYDLDNTPHLKHKLPKDIENLCLKYLRNLNLTYGCIDMIVTPDDEYIFLELNPNGQFGWIEELTGFPITENIARMLIKGSIDYEIKGWDD